MAAPLHILVVEDNSAALELLVDMLALLGHRTRAVRNAEDAMQTLQHDRFDLLLTDINLPGMSGLELARAAATALPALKVIFVSGFGYLITDRASTAFDFILLPKPYGLAQLHQAIERIAALPASGKLLEES